MQSMLSLNHIDGRSGTESLRFWSCDVWHAFGRLPGPVTIAEN